MSSENNKADQVDTFTNAFIRSKLRIKGTTLRRYQNALLDAGLIRILSGKPATGYTYQIVDLKEYQTLQDSITGVLDEILVHCERASTPKVSQPKNGSRKLKKTKDLTTASYRFEKREQG